MPPSEGLPPAQRVGPRLIREPNQGVPHVNHNAAEANVYTLREPENQNQCHEMHTPGEPPPEYRGEYRIPQRGFFPTHMPLPGDPRLRRPANPGIYGQMDHHTDPHNQALREISHVINHMAMLRRCEPSPPQGYMY